MADEPIRSSLQVTLRRFAAGIRVAETVDISCQRIVPLDPPPDRFGTILAVFGGVYQLARRP